jgi:regulator of sigma E protease
LDRPGEGVIDVECGFFVPEATSFLKRDGVRSIGIYPAGPVIVDSLMEGGPASYSGFKAGDQILSIEGIAVESSPHFSSILRENEGKKVEVVVKRDGKELTLTTAALVPSNGYKLNPDKEPLPMIGMGFQTPNERVTELLHPSPWNQITDTSRMLFVTIDGLISKDSGIKVEHLSGPVGIGKAKWHILKGEYPLRRMLYFWVLFNVNLAIFNLLPFPVLDGGHITMAIMEAIRKKPLNTRFLEVLQTSFVVLLLTMFVYVTMKDSFTSMTGEPGQTRVISKPEWNKADLEKALGSR